MMCNFLVLAAVLAALYFAAKKLGLIDKIKALLGK